VKELMNIERRTKLQIVAGATAAFVLAVALGAGGALAAVELLSDDDDPSPVAATAEPDADEPESDDALGRALEFLVDEAVAAGRLSEEDGAELKEQLERGVVPFGLPRVDEVPFGEPGSDLFGGLRDLPFLRPAIDLDVAASYLGLSSAELHDELTEGRTLAEIARAEGKSVDGLVRALVESAEERIDDAVEDGRLSEERAQELRDGLEARIRERVDEELGKFELPLRELWRDLERFRTPGG
jgi:polyhydroxyalkanoate synthesis regulator phasin